MNGAQAEQHDRRMMMRAIALSKESGAAGEYPYGVLICRAGEVVAEFINRVKHDSDVTRHAEIVAISAAPDGLPRVDRRPQNAVMLTFTLGALTVPQSLLGRAADLIE